MRYLVLVMMWVTPAAIAGALGWSGTWGSGSAFADYLIPVPVAGGVIHVPSFAVAASIILALDNSEPSTRGVWVAVGLAVFLGAMSLNIDVERFTSAMFTDYEPHGSIIRFESNPLLLFVATDSLWVAGYAFLKGASFIRWAFFALPVIPFTVLGGISIYYLSLGEPYDYGFSLPYKQLGNEVTYIHTRVPWNESDAKAWLANRYVSKPWDDINTENLAILFATSRQAIEWRNIEETASVVGTICYYENDRSEHAFRGYYDCFADRPTLQDKIDNIKLKKTEYGRKVDQWVAYWTICENVERERPYYGSIAVKGFCWGAEKQLKKLIDSTEDVATKAYLLGLAEQHQIPLADLEAP